MFTTAEDVMDATGYAEVTNAEVRQAQFVIEMYIGRTESEVDSARDKSMLSRAVIAQTVYMRDRPEITFEQVQASTISRGDGVVTFKQDDYASPFIAPMAQWACTHLSWRKSRSVRTGRFRQLVRRPDWSRD